MSYDKIDTGGKAPGTLFVGPAPQPNDRMQDWADTLVLCAHEYQPGDEDLEFNGVEVLRMSLSDKDEPQNPEDVASMLAMSKRVANQLKDGKRVVVTCAMGLNRSCLIAGMAMRMLGVPADTTIGNLRAARGEKGLCNAAYERIVRGTVPVM